MNHLCAMETIVVCGREDYPVLAGIWERSVRATHVFLDEAALNEIKAALIPVYFLNVELFAFSDGHSLVGFIGLREDMVEMLFIDSDSRGKGYGTALLDFAKRKGARKVDVNEQNPGALAFYKANGFKVAGRDPKDDAGRPYPILHLSLC